MADLAQLSRAELLGEMERLSLRVEPGDTDDDLRGFVADELQELASRELHHEQIVDERLPADVYAGLE
jgi:hypothetical protein